VIMSNDGTGSGLHIPSMLIPKKEGDILKTYIKEHPGEKISLNFNF